MLSFRGAHVTRNLFAFTLLKISHPDTSGFEMTKRAVMQRSRYLQDANVLTPLWYLVKGYYGKVFNRCIRMFLEHPLDLPDLLLEPLGGDGAGGLHLRGEDGDLVLLHHPPVLFQRLPPLRGGGGDLSGHLVFCQETQKIKSSLPANCSFLRPY